MASFNWELGSIGHAGLAVWRLHFCPGRVHSLPFQCRASLCSHSVQLCLHTMSCHKSTFPNTCAGAGEARGGRHRPDSCRWPLLWSLHGCQLVGTCPSPFCLWHCPQRRLQQVSPHLSAWHHQLHSHMDRAHHMHVYNMLCLSLVRTDQSLSLQYTITDLQ